MAEQKTGLIEQSRWKNAAAHLVLVAMALIFSYRIIQFSREYGKLAQIPVYDDVTYLRDGALRFRLLEHGGLYAVGKSYLASPPHSPWGTFAALAAYLAVGIRFSAPYAVNALLPIVLLLFINRLLRRQPLQNKILAFGLALSVPFSVYMVYEFRPDLACALFLAIGAICAFNQSWHGSTRWRRALIGACFGAALLIKPTVFLLTGLFFGWTLLLALLLDWKLVTPRPKFAALLAGTWPALLSFALISGPHLMLSLSYLLNYMRLGLVVESPIWTLKEGLAAHIGFYLVGGGGGVMLGAHLYLFVALVAAGLVAARRAGSRDAFLRLCAMALTAFLAYAIATINAVKTEFFGANFYALLLMTAYVSLDALSKDLDVVRRHAGTVLFAVLCVAGIVCFRLPPVRAERGSAYVVAQGREAGELYDRVRAYALRPDNPVKKIGFASEGPINPFLLSLYSLRMDDQPPLLFPAELGAEHVKPLTGGQVPPILLGISKFYNPSEIDGLASSVDLVVASDPENSEAYHWLPSGQHDKDIIEQFRRSPYLDEVGAIASPAGKGFVLFAHTDNKAFSGFSARSGLGPKEGPFPQWQLPVVCWGLYPSMTLVAEGNEGGKMHLSMDCRANEADQRMTIKVGGEEKFNHAFLNPGVFEFLETDLELPAGGEIVFEYAHGAPFKEKPMAVLFRSLRLKKSQ